MLFTVCRPVAPVLPPSPGRVRAYVCATCEVILEFDPSDPADVDRAAADHGEKARRPHRPRWIDEQDGLMLGDKDAQS